MKFKDWWGKEHSLPKNKSIHWRPSAYGLIIKNHQVLLIKAKTHNLWELPGGGVELNETIIDTLKREVCEETGYKITVKNKQPIYIQDNYFYAPDLDKYFRAIPMVFLAKIITNKPKVLKNNKEVSEIAWFDLNHLPKPMNQIASKIIKQYKE